MTFALPVLAVAGGTAILAQHETVPSPSRVRVLFEQDEGANTRSAILGSGKTITMDATVNAVPVTFVVDTGASISVLTPADARRTGAREVGVQEVLGIGGRASARRVVVDIEVAGRPIRGIEAVVAQDAIVSLMGMDVLHALGTPHIVIHQHPDPRERGSLRRSARGEGAGDADKDPSNQDR